MECVYSAIEVKAKRTIAEIEKSFKNMKSVRRYPIDNKKKYTQSMYGRAWEIWPITYFVIAYDSKIRKDRKVYRNMRIFR